MSASSTPSVSSGQTRYLEALEMQPQQTDSFTREVEEATNVPPQSSQGNLRDTSQPLHGEAPLKDVDDETEQKTLPHPSEPQGEEKYLSELKAALGRTGSHPGKRDSVRATRNAQANQHTSAFADGAPLAGPNAEPDMDEALVARGAKAERSLSEKQKDRIVKEEREDSKKFSKLLKTESTTEKVALDSALKTLSSLQGLHKAAIKREAKAEVSHSSAVAAAQKAETRYQEEKARAAQCRARAEARCMEEHARWEGKQGEVQAQQERLESARETVKEMEARIADCAREVERLRIVKATDEREREARLTEMVAHK